MKTNIGDADRLIRILLAIISVYFAYTYSPFIYIITAILLGTAIVGWCGLYTLLGINTASSKKKVVPKKKVRSKK